MTPPAGIAFYIAASVSSITAADMFRAALILMFVTAVAVVLLSVFPGLIDC